jgi:hypothetical protein
MHKRLSLPLVLIALVLGIVANVQAGTSKDQFDLKGEVYQAFKIEMKNGANRKLTSVRAGTYRIKVEDHGTIHNFRLIGPGINRATSIPRRSEGIWTVKLRPGKYTFLCDPHAGQMRGTFRVT